MAPYVCSGACYDVSQQQYDVGSVYRVQGCSGLREKQLGRTQPNKQVVQQQLATHCRQKTQAYPCM
jgi:hypothetical protein